MIHYFIFRLKGGIKSFKIIFVKYAFVHIRWKTWQFVRFWCSTCVEFIPLLDHNIEPSWSSCFFKRSCKISNNIILWAWACEQDGIFLNIIWWREWNMVTLHFVTSKKNLMMWQNIFPCTNGWTFWMKTSLKMLFVGQI